MLDRDPEAIAAAQGYGTRPAVAMKTPFGALESALAEARLQGKVDGILFDLVCLRHEAGRTRAGSVS